MSTGSPVPPLVSAVQDLLQLIHQQAVNTQELRDATTAHVNQLGTEISRLQNSVPSQLAEIAGRFDRAIAEAKAAGDLRIDGLAQSMLAAVQSITTEQLKSQTFVLEQLGAILARLSKLDGGAAGPTNPPDEIPPGLYVRQGQFMHQGKPFRSFGFNAAGYAFTGKPDQVKRFLDMLAGMDCKVLRLLHYGRDIADGIDDFKPTWPECLLGLDKLDFWMDELASRGMFAHLTIHHRQRFSRPDAEKLFPAAVVETLFGVRPSGIVPGEMSDLIFLFDELLEWVVDVNCREIARRYAKHPALGLVDPINELWGNRCRGYYPHGERDRLDPSTPLGKSSPMSHYGIRWFRLLDVYRGLTGYTDKEMTAARIAEFGVWNGRRVFRRLQGALREFGMTCPLGTSSFYGANRMASLMEAILGDYINAHCYPENDIDPDPFSEATDPLTQRTIGSALAALNVSGWPLILTEWAAVYQQGAKKLQKSPSYARSPIVVAKAARQQGAQIVNHYAAAFGPLANIEAKTNLTVYDGAGDPEFMAAADQAGKLFLEPHPVISVMPVRLENGDLYGTELAGKITLPAVFGNQTWAMRAAATDATTSLALPPVRADWF